MMGCIPVVVIACAVKLSFVEFYRKSCYDAAEGTYWAGHRYELNGDVLRRVLDGTALYQDYLEQRRTQCSSISGSELRGTLPPR